MPQALKQPSTRFVFLRVLCDLRGKKLSSCTTRLLHLRPSACICGFLSLLIAEAYLPLSFSVPSVSLWCQFVPFLSADGGPPAAIPSFIHHGGTEDTEENKPLKPDGQINKD